MRIACREDAEAMVPTDRRGFVAVVALARPQLPVAAAAPADGATLPIDTTGMLAARND